MSSPRVTVIVPAYNSGLWLLDCLHSIKRQTFPDFICKIYDDGSTDNTRLIADEFSKADSRFIVIPDDNNIGTPKRVAKAYSEVTSEFFCQVDSDDMIVPYAIETLIKIFEGCNKGIGVVYSDYSKIDTSGTILYDDKHFVNRCRKVHSLKRMQTKGFCAFQFRLIRTSAFNKIGGLSSDIKTGEDFDLVLQLSEVCQFLHLRKRLYLYRQHQNQTSRNNEHLLEHTCKTLMGFSSKKKHDVDFGIVIRYFGVDSLYSLRKWVQQDTKYNILIAVITDTPDDEDLVECLEYSHHSVKTIPERQDENTDYANIVSRMIGNKPTFDIKEDLVPDTGAIDDIIEGKSLPIYTLEPRTTWLLQSGMIDLIVVKELDDNPVETFGNGIKGNSFLYRLTREQTHDL